MVTMGVKALIKRNALCIDDAGQSIRTGDGRHADSNSMFIHILSGLPRRNTDTGNLSSLNFISVVKVTIRIYSD